jgi:cell filamentation protein
VSDRYSADGVEGTYQPGSNSRVLANILGIVDPVEMAEAELLLLQKLYEAVLIDGLPNRRLEVADLKVWHRRWLGNLYRWAGEERSVNLSKGDFHFAAAAQIPRLLAEFERDCLTRFTPCHAIGEDTLSQSASAIFPNLLFLLRSVRSSCATLWPVSMAVELATARMIAFLLGVVVRGLCSIEILFG